MNYFTITAGRLECGRVRDHLAASRLKGLDIRWHESSGWFERVFTITGASGHLFALSVEFQEWIRERGAA
jgi:hypothetical protein